MIGDGPGAWARPTCWAIGNQETCPSIAGPSGCLIAMLRDFISVATIELLHHEIMEDCKWGKAVLLVVIAKNEAMFQDLFFFFLFLFRAADAAHGSSQARSCWLPVYTTATATLDP